MAASATVRAIGPAVSCECAMGMMPVAGIRPRVGLIPTTPLVEAGHTMEPSVSVPMASAHRLAETAAPDPELEPQALRSRAYGLRVRPPRPLQPLVEWLDRKLAHSLRLVLPNNTAPAARKRCATIASRAAMEPTRASEPAVVIMRSAVSLLSLIRTGMPCKGPRGPLALRSASRAAAMDRASGLSSITELSAGPRLSMAAMRSRYR